ncbi:MAG: DUF1295 domain-containing protein [Halanaerobium sp.]
MNIFVQVAILLFIYFTGFYIFCMLKNDNSYVDIAWGFGYVVAVLFTLIRTEIATVDILVALMVTVWGGRLGIHILSRKIGKPEDFRYQQMRKNWNNFYIQSFFRIFMLQGFLLYIIVYPSIKIISNNVKTMSLLGYIGVLVWLIGFGFEVIADWQLKKFIENRESKAEIMNSGLWKYSRHPNYFGEALLWWGIYLIALDTVGGLLIILSPILITFLVRFVSGVPLLEKRYEDHENYQKYAEKTNIFFPWFPKKD